MTRDEIVAFFSRREEAYGRRDGAALTMDHAEACVVESPMAGAVRGRAAIEEVYRRWFAAFPDLVYRSEDLLIDGERVAVVATRSGTDLGGFMGLPPTGKPFRFSSVSLCTLSGAQIVHERRIYDFTGLLVQIGVLKAKPA